MNRDHAPRSVRMMLLLSLAGGCTEDPKSTPDDTGSDTAADDTGTPDSTPPDGTLEGLTFSINERVPTVVNVAWDGTAVAGETFVEYGLDGALDQRTRAGTDASASLLGLKAGRSYSFRAVTLPTEGGRWESEVATVDLAVPPEGLPVFTISDYDPAQAAAGGFVLTSLVQVDNSWTIILDRDGDYVWFLQAADGLSLHERASNFLSAYLASRSPRPYRCPAPRPPPHRRPARSSGSATPAPRCS